MFPTSPMHADGSVSLSLNDSGSQDDMSMLYYQSQSHSGMFQHQQQSNSQYSPTSFDLQQQQRRQLIDYTKFKTKMCRHFLMGQQCPFMDRCVFAHGNDQIRAQPPVVAQQQQMPPPPPSYNNFISGSIPQSPVDSRPNTPPAYPSRFRYEPYSASGIVFEA